LAISDIIESNGGASGPADRNAAEDGHLADGISSHSGNCRVDCLTLTRNAESTSIVARRQSHDALKDLSE